VTTHAVFRFDHKIGEAYLAELFEGISVDHLLVRMGWAPRIAQGTSTLYEHALKGFQGKTGMMPPKGGSTAPDADVKAAVDYMVAAAK